ncbi:HsdR family type I site-specific deoxyribonuclease [Massilia sp. W12]|uniref:type I restriction endonuclease subunit R n=1 Tax=Massilia sp. W12 TaxID=3126507 RepID=UPI0030CF8C78
MSHIGKPEHITQARVIKLFHDELGYTFLGDWSERRDNSNIEAGLLNDFLSRSGYAPEHISAALLQLRQAANKQGELYDNNKAVYGLLRYGVTVATGKSSKDITLRLIDWDNPQANDFAIAEEVTLRGKHERRPDLVLYVNGIAIGVLELKKSTTEIGEGIRQNLSNQRAEFHADFFSTVQLVLAGNDTQGLRYGTIKTEEKFFLSWKEDEADNSRYKLDKYLLKLCNKTRLIELLHDFVLFDGGIKKLPRPHQYFGIKAAQAHVMKRQGGIIWHTQGAGKSLMMVWLAKWILENLPQARVAIITDRSELDAQIKDVFSDAGEDLYRTSSGRDLLARLAQPAPRLLCSLVHKFGRRGVDDFEAFLKDLRAQPSRTSGEIFVFVDECHRTQSGKFNQIMKAILPNAVFIGFTGTPLYKADKASSVETFGSYIHTYIFPEAVADGVVLDLIYEARDIDQRLGSTDKIDRWFESRTQGLNAWQKDELKKQWGTLQKVLSSKSRMDRVVENIIFDFELVERLKNGRGNAILVASSIYEACKYFGLFQQTIFRDRCALITSYNPQARDVTLEEIGDNTETEKQFIYNTYNTLLKEVEARPGQSKTESYEALAKRRFVKEPGLMKLLIVVDKLLTGFDAPSCTYLYIDKTMQDHGLFQAICRTNRLDGEDKQFGYIVDFKDLFKKVEKAIAVYTTELDQSVVANPQVLMHNRLSIGRERLDNALMALALLCEPVAPPKDELAHIHYFCGNTEIPTDLEDHAPRRIALYRAVVALLRAWGNIADEAQSAGYSEGDVLQMRAQLAHYVKLRELIRQASNETLDLKPFEAGMRYLIDTYIEAEEPRTISDFDGMGLLEVIVNTGIADAIAAKLSNMNGNRAAIAEAIENNVRSTIIRESLTDPAYFARMSALLSEIIALRREKAIEYEDYLARIAALASLVQAGQDNDLPKLLDTPGKRKLYQALQNMKAPPATEGILAQDEVAFDDPAMLRALRIDRLVKERRPDSWRDSPAKENVIKATLAELFSDENELNQIFLILKGDPEY